jgi:hypothetical protein
MKIIRPAEITNAMVTTNVPELYANWSGSTTYAIGARVVRGDSVYESIQGSNLNNDPLTQPTWWIRIGSSQKMAPFDGQISDMVKSTSDIEITVQPGSIIDSVSYFGVKGTNAVLIVRDGLGGPIIYEDSQSLEGTQSVSWYQYFFFDPFLLRTQALFSNIPPVNDPHLTIIIEGVTDVQLGEVVMGRQYEMGCAAFGARSGIIDFSRKETDEFGTTTFVKRNFSKRVDCQIIIENFNLNRVQRTLYDVRSTPLTWIVADDPRFEEPLVVYGFYRDFTTEIAYPNHSLCNIEIEGLI